MIQIAKWSEKILEAVLHMRGGEALIARAHVESSGNVWYDEGLRELGSRSRGIRMRTRSLVAAMLFASMMTGAHADISISSNPTHNMNCSAGVCTPTARNAVLNVTDLANMLAAGDATVQTGDGNNTAAGIKIINGFSWTSTNRLTLTAKYNIVVKAPVVVAGTGALTITYGTGNPKGDLLLVNRGKIDFWDVSSSLIINGNTYTLASNIKSLSDAIATGNGNGYYALSMDYDASVDGTYNAPPIGWFDGSFEGLGHTIDHLTIANTSVAWVGFFYAVQGTISDIRLTNAAVTDQADYRQYTGALVAYLSGTIKSSFVSGSIADTDSVGGMVGYADDYGQIINSRSEVVVSGQGNVGGLIGWVGSASARIESSSASGSVTATNASAGGLVGQNWGTIVDSFASGRVTGQEASAGGLVGVNRAVGAIINSHAEGAVEVARGPAGGVVAVNEEAAYIERSYATGTVTGDPVFSPTSVNSDGVPCTRQIGGLVGSATGKISNSYALGQVTAASGYCGGGLIGEALFTKAVGLYSTGSVPSGVGAKTGGFTGFVDRHTSCRGCYWDVDTSGTDRGSGNKNWNVAVGLSDSELKSGLPTGFDPKIWGQSPDINSGYPYLLANPPN